MDDGPRRRRPLSLLITVVLRVGLRRLPCMMQRTLMMPMRCMRVMGRFLVIAAVMRCRGVFVVATRVLAMLWDFAMMFSSLCRHISCRRCVEKTTRAERHRTTHRLGSVKTFLPTVK
jgi:hypothetical protein